MPVLFLSGNKKMTTQVTVTACCSEDKEVKVYLMEGEVESEDHTLQNGESKDFYVYDDREISVLEKDK